MSTRATTRNFNPFAEVGIGVMSFTPLRDAGTQSLDVTKANKSVGVLSGLGLAYELSPSFDIRVSIAASLPRRRVLMKRTFKTSRYEWFLRSGHRHRVPLLSSA